MGGGDSVFSLSGLSFSKSFNVPTNMCIEFNEV